MENSNLCPCGCGLTEEVAAKPTTFFSFMNFHNIDFSQAHLFRDPVDYGPEHEDQDGGRRVMKYIVSKKEVLL